MNYRGVMTPHFSLLPMLPTPNMTCNVMPLLSTLDQILSSQFLDIFLNMRNRVTVIRRSIAAADTSGGNSASASAGAGAGEDGGADGEGITDDGSSTSRFSSSNRLSLGASSQPTVIRRGDASTGAVGSVPAPGGVAELSSGEPASASSGNTSDCSRNPLYSKYTVEQEEAMCKIDLMVRWTSASTPVC